MKRQDFIKHLDERSEWWIDVDRDHAAGSGRRKKDGTLPQLEPNEAGGYPVVRRFKPIAEFCHHCCKMVEDRRETINVQTRTAKCNKCRGKYSVLFDFPPKNSK